MRPQPSARAPRDAAGELPVLTSKKVRCPWCQAEAEEVWLEAAEKAEIAAGKAYRGAWHRSTQIEDPVAREKAQQSILPISPAKARAAGKAKCPSCEKPFRVVKKLGDEHVIHGARSDKDEEYLAWKARQAAAAGGGT